MKKKIPVIVALIITIVAAVFVGNTTKANRIYNNSVNTIKYNGLGTLENDQVITQEFICKEDVINGFKIKSHIEGNYADVIVHLELKDAQTSEVLAVIEEQGKNIKPRKVHYYKADEPITGLAGRDLILSVKEIGSTGGNGITMYYAPAADAQYKISVNGTEIDGLLPMATAAERFDIETFVVFLLSVWFIWGFMWFLYKLFQ